MNTKNIKRIIAREGFVLLGLIIICVLLFWITDWIAVHTHNNLLWLVSRNITIGIILGYPLYLLIRFAIWALRTLREK